MKNLLLLCFILMNVVTFAQASLENNKRGRQRLQFIFQNTVNGAVLQSDRIYRNAFGEPFTIRSFKYYISDIELQYQDRSFKETGVASHLVNETDSASKSFYIDAPAGNITAIRFLLGVDSAANSSGIQTGALDPAKGMYWIWNTGYIMAKLEGSSPVSKAPGKQFSYDIGGYKSGEQAAREVTLALPATGNGQPATMIIQADVAKWFSGRHDIKISEQPMCHEPGKLAMQIGDNYESMFSMYVQ